VEYAEKANKLAPDQPGILDTLGTLLVEKGDTARGIELLQKATKLAPADPSIRLSLARALISTGQKDAAKKELEELAKLGDTFKSQADVEQLMKGI
jgi:cytochrome c-type biogenesis protein CcmH/NrfG